MTSQRSWTNAAIFQFFNFLWTRQTPKLSPKPDMTASQTLGGGHHRDLVLTDHHPALRLTTEPTPTRLSDSNRRPEPTRRPPKWTRDPDRSAWQTLGGGRHRDLVLTGSSSRSSTYDGAHPHPPLRLQPEAGAGETASQVDPGPRQAGLANFGRGTSQRSGIDGSSSRSPTYDGAHPHPPLRLQPEAGADETASQVDPGPRQVGLANFGRGTSQRSGIDGVIIPLSDLRRSPPPPASQTPTGGRSRRDGLPSGPGTPTGRPGKLWEGDVTEIWY
ncbi:uncharacterized protein LOC113639449 isoform X2 [Tachysurus fulvidraco]|uniref:uncharacterized protein LOC125140218 n=1 Tax=Tachysurus fulvidraco TaxID=1234273 RepID=UPI000F50A426|nr:uncharacterized protein LOC125140218 [Tachysurus fulvidraco]XP_047664431.1 uncharacterized protein LOC113639449 isoform X1 [Tachysurus fulvidraco]XP_047664432.1 uncharacterized protein LOC113639449 isoform X2 [Tachysurus fulvidraco]